MQKKLVSLFFLSLVSFSLSSCHKEKEAKTFNYYVSYIYKNSGDIVFLSDNDTNVISPFNTSISGRLYYYSHSYSQQQIDKIGEEFSNDFIYYHAISDRHYDYKYLNSDERITNVKTINDSYGKNEFVKVSDELFELLKRSYDFTLNSNGKFNMFLGSLASIYENKFSSLNDEITSLDYALSLANDFQVSSDIPTSLIANALKSVPTIEEIKEQNILEFDENKKSVKFNALKRKGINNEDIKVEISLGGNGKGYATEKITDKLKNEYKNIAFLINSGSSSIKAIGKKPDNSNWNLLLVNPLMREKLENRDSYNPTEIVFSLSNSFNLSTSGYYEQYFYVYDKDNQNYLRRTHILNPLTGYSIDYFDQVSVCLDDSFLADMYTTAIMNCSTIEEANQLFKQLNSIYKQEDASLILFYPSNINSNHYFLNQNQLSPLSENNLPICLLNKDKEYQGDYNDISRDMIKEVKTKSNRDDEYETVLISNNIFDYFSIPLNNSQAIPNKNHVVTILKRGDND